MSDIQSIDLRFRNTEDEAVGAVSQDAESLTKVASVKLIGLLALTAVFVIVSVGVAIFQIVQAFQQGIAPLLFAIFFVLMIIVIFLHRRQQGKKGEEDVIVSITPYRVAYDSSMGTTEFPWSHFVSFHESENTYALKAKDEVTVLVFPKREFSNEQANWFRKVASQKAGTTELKSTVAPELDIPAVSSNHTHFDFTLNLRDYFDRTLCSWTPRVIGLAMFIFIQLFFLYTTFFMEKPKNAVVPEWQVWLFMTGMFVVMMPLIVIPMFTWNKWKEHRKTIKRTSVVIAHAGLMHTCDSLTKLLEWNEKARFKESRRSFYVWWNDSEVWFLLPKRVLNDTKSAQRCREILSRNARQSTWYW